MDKQSMKCSSGGFHFPSRVVHRQVADHGVAPEGFIPVESHTPKGSRSCEEHVEKGISYLA
jgi:hypothetical protein